MKRQKKPETLKGIVQKMLYGGCDDALPRLIKLVYQVRKEIRQYGEVDFDGVGCRKILDDIEWMMGYESCVKETFEYLLEKMDKQMFSKDASHTTIMSAIVYYCVLYDILNPEKEYENWEEHFVDTNVNLKFANCIEVLKRHCSKELTLEGFSEARRYIRLWDSEFNW